MISQKNKDLARWAMDFALKNGCSASRISVYTGVNNSFEYRDTQLDKLQQSSENSMSIELFVDEKSASYNTNSLNQTELEKFILNGIITTRYLAKDPARQLPDPKRYYKGDSNGLKRVDLAYDSISVDDKIILTKQAVGEIYGSDQRLISVSSEFADGNYSSYKVASNGFEGETENTYYTLSVDAALKGVGDARPSDGWYDTSNNWTTLKKNGIGKIALERTIRKLGQEKLESGIFPMLVENLQISRLLYPILSALNGSSLQQKNSFLIDKIGEKIFSEKVTLMDDPHIIGAMGARWFDGEGIATKKQTVIEKGVLETYFIDTYNGIKMNVEPTIQSPSILTCVHGSKNFDQLLASMQKGIWVSGFNGGNSNSTTGDFSFGIEGFFVENGKAVKPINEMNITGNLLTLWQNIIEVGNDPRLNTSNRIPSILFDAVSFSGK